MGSSNRAPKTEDDQIDQSTLAVLPVVARTCGRQLFVFYGVGAIKVGLVDSEFPPAFRQAPPDRSVKFGFAGFLGKAVMTMLQQPFSLHL
jgi:hypothetical protein